RKKAFQRQIYFLGHVRFLMRKHSLVVRDINKGGELHIYFPRSVRFWVFKHSLSKKGTTDETIKLPKKL
ncbi:MAG: hypothetical protein NWQ54_07370, partial [Paraglaciecola sp.]|nr:hypothetical protein [Paraglaciecola sp.]